MTEDKWLKEPPPSGLSDRRGLYAAAEKVRRNPGVWLLLEEAAHSSRVPYLCRSNGVRRAPALRDTDEWTYHVTTRSLRDGTDRWDIYLMAERKED